MESKAVRDDTQSAVPVVDPERPKISVASLLAAGYLVIDEEMLRSMLQAAVLDAHNEAKLRVEVEQLADRSYSRLRDQAEIDRQHQRAEDAEELLKESRSWWRRWSVHLAAITAIAGITALIFAVVLLRGVRQRVANDVLTEHTMKMMDRVATSAAKDAVALSEMRTDKKIEALSTEIASVRTDVTEMIHAEFATLHEQHEQLVREIRAKKPTSL